MEKNWKFDHQTDQTLGFDISKQTWHQAHGDSMAAVSIASLDYQKVYQIISNTSICKVNGSILRYASNT